MKTIKIYSKTFFGITFRYIETNGKLTQKFYLCNKYFSALNNLWLGKAKNKINRYTLTVGKGRGIIVDLSGKHRSMERQILEERLVRMEANPIYSRFSKIQQLEKKIVLIEKSL